VSGKAAQKRRKARKREAAKFSNYLNKMEVRLWVEYKRNNPNAECNPEFQEIVNRKDFK